MKKRMKNPWFWIGLLGVTFTAMGISTETLTSWSRVIEALENLIKNPLMLGSAATAILGVFVDPSTQGLKDCRDEN